MYNPIENKSIKYFFKFRGTINFGERYKTI